MVMNRNSNDRLWGNENKKYVCGCPVIDGRLTCPVHGKPILEQQMIYGNKTEADYLNEKEHYTKQKLNE